MKKRYLLSLPLVTIMTACGSKGTGESRINTKQSLPSEATAVSAEENPQLYAGLIQDIAGNLLNFNFHQAVFTLDAYAKVNVKLNDTQKLNLEASNQTQVGVVFNDSHASMGFKTTLPKMDYSKFKVLSGEDEVPEMVFGMFNKMAGGTVKVATQYVAAQDSTYAFVDVSDSKIKSGIIYALEQAKLPEGYTAEQMFKAVFGEGLVCANVTTILNYVYQSIVDAHPDAEIEMLVPPEYFNDPVTYVCTHFPQYLAEYNVQQYLYIGLQFLMGFEPQVGYVADKNTGAVTQEVLAVNVTASKVNEMLGLEGKDKISGSAGAYIAVGTTTGSEKLSLEDLKVAADVTFQGNKVAAKLALHVDYNAKAESSMNALLPSASAQYKDATNMLLSLISSIISQALVE